MQALVPAPPVGNTGVQTPLEGVEVSCDWLEFTLPAEYTVKEAQGVVFPTDEEAGEGWEDAGPMLGYRSAIRKGGVRILWEGHREDMGVHVIMTGKGCAEARVRAGLQDESRWRSYLNWLRTHARHWSRIDIAHDAKGGMLSMGQVVEAALSHDYSSRWASYTLTAKGGSEPGQVAGCTVLFGSRRSDSYCRVYDKAEEQGRTGQWVRVEQVFKDDRAAGMVAAIIERGFVAAAEVLRGYLEFKEPVAVTRTHRAAAAEWWLRFLQHAEKARLTVEQVERTVEQAWRWIERQVAPTFALLIHAEAGDLSRFYSLLSQGRARWRDWHRRLAGASVAVT